MKFQNTIVTVNIIWFQISSKGFYDYVCDLEAVFAHWIVISLRNDDYLPHVYATCG
jgi:hypothetical protein